MIDKNDASYSYYTIEAADCVLFEYVLILMQIYYFREFEKGAAKKVD